MIIQQKCTCISQENLNKIKSNNQDYEMCGFCQDQIFQGKENFNNLQLLKQHVNRKLQVVIENQNVYKQIIQEYSKIQKQINNLITSIVDQFNLCIEDMDQTIQKQKVIIQELARSEQIAQKEAIKFLTSDIRINREDLQKFEKQLQTFEAKLKQMKDQLQNIPHIDDMQICKDIIQNKNLKTQLDNGKKYNYIQELYFNSEVVNVQICQQTYFLAISFADNTLQIFNHSRILKLCDFLNDCIIDSICIKDMGIIDFIFGDQNGCIQLFQFLFNELQLKIINKFKLHQDKIIIILQKSKTQAISGSQDNQIIIFDTYKGDQLVKIHFKLIMMIKLDYNKWQNLLAAPSSKEISIWELENIAIQQRIQLNSQMEQEIQLQFSVNGKIFITSLCREKQIQIYNMEQNKKSFIKTNTINFNSKIINFTLGWTGPQLVIVTEQEILVIEYVNDQYLVLNKIEQTCEKFMPNLQRMDFEILLSYHKNCLLIYKSD